MRIRELFIRMKGRRVFIVGTGPSARLFPFNFLDGELVIGLNQAYRYTRCAYSLTVHPELIQEAMPILGMAALDMRWIVKRKGLFAKTDLNHLDHYLFDSTEDWGKFAKPPNDTLFVGRGIQQTAIQLCGLAGAKAAILVGVDMTDLGGDHHGHSQHVRFHGLPPADVYKEYRVWTARARKAAWDAFKLPVLSLSPLLGEFDGNEDYQRLCDERGLTPLPLPRDTSAYSRPKVDI